MLFAYAFLGGIVLLMIARAVLRRATSRRPVFAAVVWIVIFLPLLACTVPDDRILMLPSLGFAYLIGVWIAGDGESPPSRLRRLPIALFVVGHALCAFGVATIMHLVDLRSRDNFRAMIELADDPPPGSFLFVLDSTLDPQVLFAQSCFEDATGRDDVQVRYLSDSESLEASQTGPNTLRLTDTDDGLFTSFLGSMAAARSKPKRSGDVFDAGEVTGRILRVEGDRVRSVELKFRRKLDDPAYTFFRCGPFGTPILVKDLVAGR